MKKNRIEELAVEMRRLLDEMVVISKGLSLPDTARQKKAVKKNAKGATGAIDILIEEGYFDAPKDIVLIMQKMGEMGRFYTRSLISMNLLNLTRRRVMTRIKNPKSKKWEYVLRK